jgi:hypothetical protein
MTPSSISSATKSKTCSGRFNDWCRIHTRYDRCAHTLFVGNLYRRCRRL